MRNRDEVGLGRVGFGFRVWFGIGVRGRNIGRFSGGTFQSMVGKGGGVVGKGAGADVVDVGRVQLLFVFGDEGFVEAVKGINIGHHASRAVNDGEVVTKKFLGESANLV